jgi:hypothetical protein
MIQKIVNQIKFAAIAAPVYAADKISLEATDNFSGLNDLTVSSIVSGAISLVMLVVALIFFFMLVLGGLRWVMSGGDEKNVANARNQITNALIGLAIVFAAWAIVKLIETIFGVSIISGITIPTL